MGSQSAYDAASSGWYNARNNLILAKSGSLAVSSSKSFVFTLQPVTATTSANFICDNGWTSPGETIYVTGNIPELGNWNPSNGVQLDASVYHEYIYNPPPGHNGPGPSNPVWTSVINNLPANSSIEWKCVKQLNGGGWQWESGGNNLVVTPTSDYAGRTYGNF